MRLTPLTVLLLACLAAGPALAQTPDCLDSLESDLPAAAPSFELRPVELPAELRVAEDWLFRLTPSNCGDDACSIEWKTDQPGVAKWLDSAPPCGDDACAILETVSPGFVRLTVRVCSEDEGACRTKTLDLEVRQ